ncbi:hypothetical protein AAMO2058_000475500, partial [Amorphochlora amoebiformis]
GLHRKLDKARDLVNSFQMREQLFEQVCDPLGILHKVRLSLSTIRPSQTQATSLKVEETERVLVLSYARHVCILNY